MLRVLKSGLIGLLIVGTASASPSGYAKAHGSGVPVLKFDFPPVPLAVSASSYLVRLVEPQRPAIRGGWCGGGGVRRLVEMCGGVTLQFSARKSKLADPVPALGAAYLKCRAIKADVLDPRVPVASYPAGYFGEWVDEGELVTHRVEFAEEAEIGLVFALLVEAVGDPEDPEEYWMEESAPGTEATVGDYRRDTGFVPELTVEFVGEVPLRVELSLAGRRALVQAGDKWDSYTLDRRTAVALKELLIAGAHPGG